MKIRDCDEIATWLAEAGLLGIRSEGSLVQAFCERCIEAGLPLGKSFVMIDTLHPMHEARAFFWDEDKSIGFQEVEYPSSRDGDAAELWKRSPFLQMLRRRESTLRCRLETGETRGFPAIEELRDAGQTDYLAIVYRIRQAMRVEDVDAFYARWTTARPGGFSEEEVGVLSRLTPHLGLAVRSAAQTRLTKTLVEAYLGQGPGRQVLSGGIRHDSVKRINAVLWFSDITGYTNLSESVQNDQLVPLINDYAEAVIGAVKGAGGDVLKLIGDGVLAMFTSSRPEYACRAAVEAERDMRARLLQLARRRQNDGLPVADIHLGLHAGRVFYGNIGTPDRLDFTVVGQPVNEVSRISSMCQSAGRKMLCSSEFAELLLGEEREKLVSVGRFALRGVGRAQELFTLDPGLSLESSQPSPGLRRRQVRARSKEGGQA
jgi:adenylate cyclase